MGCTSASRQVPERGDLEQRLQVPFRLDHNDRSELAIEEVAIV
jgi:hypothetical protein